MSKQKKEIKETEDDSSKQMPPVRKYEARAIRVTDWVASLSKRATRFEDKELIESMKTAAAAMARALSIVQDLPDECGAETKSSSGSAFEIGAMVNIKERVHSAYEDLLPPADLVNLEVVKVAKGKVAVNTPGGVRMFLPKAHLVPAE